METVGKVENSTPKYTWKARDDTRFPPIMAEFANQTFKHVYEINKPYVEYMLKIRKATGIYKAFQDYCKKRLE